MAAIIKLAAFAATMAATTAAAAGQEDPVIAAKYAPNVLLQLNLAFRVFMAILGTMMCWVPFRLLWRNGDFAAVALIADVALINFFTVLNSLIWHTDNWDTWFDGEGLCDVEVYLQIPLNTVYAACIFAIIQRLAGQVKLARASQPTRRERRKRAWMQAAVIFPIPAFQVLFTWFDLRRRYNVATLVGCMIVLDSSWPRFVVYDAPIPIFVIASVPFACKWLNSYIVYLLKAYEK